MNELKFKLEQLSDENLIKEITAFRVEVLEILYERYERRIYYKAKSLLKNNNDASDLSHDIFIKIFTNINQFEGRSNFSLWVHSITFNSCMKYLRDQKKISFFELTDSHKEDIIDVDLSEQKLLALQVKEIEMYMENLKEDEKYTLILKYIDGLKIREISELIGLKESAVKMKLKRSREKILIQYNKDHQNE